MMHQKCPDSDTLLQAPDQSVPPIAHPGDAWSTQQNCLRTFYYHSKALELGKVLDSDKSSAECVVL